MNVADGLGHFLVLEQSVRAPKLFWEIQASSHEERRPVDGVETDDFFSDQMHVSRPVTSEFVFFDGVANGGDVVGERVGPDVENVLFVTLPRNAPLQSGTADGKVAQAATTKEMTSLRRASGWMNSGFCL